jgi:hypothetical protein
MPAQGEVILAGEYTVTYSGQAMGIMEGDAGLPTLSQQNKGEPVANTNRYGKSTIDGFYQGGDWFCQFTCLEYTANTLAAWWPFSATLGLMGVIARRYFDMAQALVLTAVAGTPAFAAASPLTLTSPRAILAPGYNTQTLYGPTHRKLPVRLQLFPFNTGGAVIGWFTET